VRAPVGETGSLIGKFVSPRAVIRFPSVDARRIFLVLLICAARPAAAAPTLKWTDPYPGIRHLRYHDPAVPLTIHVVTVDITSQEIHLRATPSSERGRTVSEFATCANAGQGCVQSDVALNADLFRPLGFVPANLAIGDRALWQDAATDGADEGWLAFGRPSNNLNAVQLQAPELVALPPAMLDADGAISGRPMLIRDGVVAANFDCNDASEPCRPAPRSAVGLDALGVTLFVAVVDGDQQSSVGLTDADLAAFLLDLGAWDVLALDMGASSALYIGGEGGLVSSPSDGIERPVANHLGIHYGALQHCSVIGFVFDKVIGGTKLTNATVTLDGKTGAWDNPHQLFNFADVEPHRVCVVAKAPGYMTGQQCRQVTLADIQQDTTQYCSVALQPGADPPPQKPDLGVPAPHDLGHALDRGLAPEPDAATSPATGGGCSCALGGRSETAIPFLEIAISIFVLVISRRRLSS
jgi:hypothetical protein